MDSLLNMGKALEKLNAKLDVMNAATAAMRSIVRCILSWYALACRLRIERMKWRLEVPCLAARRQEMIVYSTRSVQRI